MNDERVEFRFEEVVRDRVRHPPPVRRVHIGGECDDGFLIRVRQMDQSEIRS